MGAPNLETKFLFCVNKFALYNFFSFLSMIISISTKSYLASIQIIQIAIHCWVFKMPGNVGTEIWFGPKKQKIYLEDMSSNSKTARVK